MSSFPRLSESVTVTICVCQHQEGWRSKVVGSKPSQVDFSAKSLIRGCWLNQVAIDFFYSSSGYGTTPGSSNVSSQCSSQVCETLSTMSTMSDHLFTRRGSINLPLHILQLSSKQCTSNSSLTSLCIKSTSTNEILQNVFSGTSLQMIATPPWLTWRRVAGRPHWDQDRAASGY